MKTCLGSYGSGQEANHKLACAIMGKAQFLAAVCDLLTVEIEKARKQVCFWELANGENFYFPLMGLILVAWGGGDLELVVNYSTKITMTSRTQKSKDIALALCRELSKYF